MPEPAKEIHMATSLTELRNSNAIDLGKWKGQNNEMLLKSAKKLYTNAKDQLKEVEPDEELVFVYLFRAMQFWQIIMKTADFASHKKYYEYMYGKEMKDVVLLLEEYSQKLEKRYADKANNLDSKESLRNQFQLATIVVPKKRKEGKGSSNEIPNGSIKAPLATDQKSLDDYTLILNPSFKKSNTDYYGEKKFMECEELKERLETFLDILVIDIRPKRDYELSKIRSVHSVNIPGKLITAGLSANKLGEMIAHDEEKGYWGQRDQYEQVVLLDWHSEEKDVVPACHLSNLYVSLTKWDPDCIYKNKPVILNGGFERFFDSYPTFTTNPKITPPPKERICEYGFVHLSEHSIEYPMSVLEEEDDHSIAKTSKTVSTLYSDLTSDLTICTAKPTIDRTTKPTQLSDKSEFAPKPLKDGEKSVSTTGTERSQPQHRTVVSIGKKEDEKETRPRSIQAGESPSATSSTPHDRTVTGTVKGTVTGTVTEKRGSPTPSSSTLSRPVTPPRSEKHITLTSKVNTVMGDGDGEIHLERTKFDTPTRSGLKRSASSPNINKLGEEDLDKSTPIFDRSTKPKPSYDYIPRSAGTDTVYLADSTKKGRGLTGLKNLGNLCYMNSIMQCISHTEELMKELTRFNTKETRNGQTRVASEVSSLLRILWQGDTRITSCRNLKMKVGALRHSFSTMEQQDSHEFLTILVDWLHEDLNEPSDIRSLAGADVATGEKAWGEFRRKNNSVVVELFYGQLKSTVTCDHCQAESVLFEPFSNLSIPLPSGQDDKDRTFTLQECLKLYLKGESISGWVCPSCKTARKATKKLDITRLPPVLIIHLKRFMSDTVGVGWCRKRMNMVDFPISDLNMKPFTHPESELRIHSYNLYAVSNHYGSMESGHYTAYCKNHALNKWYKFDDQDVNEISPGEVKSSAAYILFYESSHLGSHSTIEAVTDRY